MGVTDNALRNPVCLRINTVTADSELDGCIVWNVHNTVLGEEVLLIYIVPVCYVKQVGMEKPSNIIISLHRKNFQLLRIFH